MGAISNSLCPAPCNLTYVPIIAQPSLGITGYLFWRVPITAITVDTYSNPQAGTGLTSTSVVLGASQVNSQKSTPLAVLDSGGVQILVGYRPFADAIYSAAGISMSSDGYCKLISLRFDFSLTDYRPDAMYDPILFDVHNRRTEISCSPTRSVLGRSFRSKPKHLHRCHPILKHFGEQRRFVGLKCVTMFADKAVSSAAHS